MSSSLDATCPHIPVSLNLKRRGWDCPGWLAQVGWPGLCCFYLMAPPDKCPEALAFMVEPKPTAFEQVASLGFLEARVPRGGQAAREHLPVAVISSQVSLRWGCTRMRVPGYRGSKFCWALCQGSDLTAWNPLPESTPGGSFRSSARGCRRLPAPCRQWPVCTQ